MNLLAATKLTKWNVSVEDENLKPVQSKQITKVNAMIPDQYPIVKYQKLYFELQQKLCSYSILVS